MPEHAEAKYTEGRGVALLWVIIVAGALAWAVHLELAFMLVPWACATGLYGYLWLVVFVALCVPALAAFVGWRIWNEAGGEWPGDEPAPIGRIRFMAATAMVLNLMFLLAIIAQGIPEFIFNPCQ